MMGKLGKTHGALQGRSQPGPKGTVKGGGDIRVGTPWMGRHELGKMNFKERNSKYTDQETRTSMVSS